MKKNKLQKPRINKTIKYDKIINLEVCWGLGGGGLRLEEGARWKGEGEPVEEVVGEGAGVEEGGGSVLDVGEEGGE